MRPQGYNFNPFNRILGFLFAPRPMNKLLILTTMPDEAGANRLARTLIEGSLAACVNILPAMQSIYSWKGNLQQGTEQQLLIKTLEKHYHAVETCIHDNHPYELPEIIAVPISKGLPEYMQWIDKSCQTPDETH